VPSTAQRPLVLVVDDDEGLLILMAEALRAEGLEIGTASSLQSALSWLKTHTPDLLILDLNLRDATGPALVARLQRDRAPVPFVVVTGQGDEKAAVDIMKQGALDYVMKDTGLLDLLPTVVKHALADISQQKALAAARQEHARLEDEIIAVSERERHRIGADLHDGLGQQLTAIELMCTTLKADVAAQPALARRLDDIGRMLREAISLTRSLARGLVPVGSDPDALQIGLAEFANRTNTLGRVRCDFECPQPVAVSDPVVARHLYRIAQEAVNNALKHADARRITIKLEEKSGELRLEISDDGIGMPNPKAAQGLGLGVMQHRAKAIGGEFSLMPRRGGGVTVRCRLPAQK
jgi:signal transduction histidine kinase